MRKFEKDASQGLLDRRSKGLDSKPTLPPEEELQLKNKQLEERNRYLEMEVGLLAVACCQSCRHPVPNAWTSLAGLSVTCFDSNGQRQKVRRNQTQKPTVRLGRYLEEFQAIKDYSDKHSGASISQLCQ